MYLSNRVWLFSFEYRLQRLHPPFLDYDKREISDFYGRNFSPRKRFVPSLPKHDDNYQNSSDDCLYLLREYQMGRMCLLQQPRVKEGTVTTQAGFLLYHTATTKQPPLPKTILQSHLSMAIRGVRKRKHNQEQLEIFVKPIIQAQLPPPPPVHIILMQHVHEQSRKTATGWLLNDAKYF
jgi:hypothetical protein